MSEVALPSSLPQRDPRGHKGTFGTVAVIGGCARRAAGAEGDERGAAPGLTMLGGPAFAALAALRVGCGLARLVLPEPLVAHALTIAPSATGVPLAVDESGDLVPHLGSETIDEVVASARALVVGPGMGVSAGASAAVLRCVQQEEAPVVLDADALNNLAETPELHRDFRAAAVLTPHVGEFRTLARVLGIAEDPALPAERESGAEALAQKLGAVVVLKSSTTVVTDGQRTWTHDEPNPALATGGTGDILSGMIGGLIAQHYRRTLGAGSRVVTPEQQGGDSLFGLACAAVAAHAAAARAWSREKKASGGMLATDLLEFVPGAVEALRRG